MNNSWKQWQGRTVDGKYVLGTYLGGSEGSAVFRTRVGSDLFGGASIGNREAEAEAGLKTDAAIKLLVADGAEGESPLRRWQEASKLTHPNLIRILAVGRAAVDGRELVYAIEEFAEENLGQVVPERALVAEEMYGTLLPVLAALEFVHGRGLVHGAIRPSNILGVEDQVKLSSDTLRPAGEVPRTISLYDAPEVLTAGISVASDVWSLGMTLVEVLTQHLPAWDPARMSPPEVGPDVPEPFREIAQRCLMLDPAKRCGLREIADRLQAAGAEARTKDRPAGPGEGKTAPVASAGGNPAPVEAIAASQKKAAKRPYLLVLAAAIAVTIFLIARPRPSSPPDQPQTSSAPPQTSSSQTSVPPASVPQTSSPRASSSPTERATPADQSPAQPPTSAAPPSGEQKAVATDEIVERAMPQVSPSARRTISGKIKVRVRVDVDAAGNVTEAKLKTPGPSKYFARLSLEAARRWKFAPAPDGDRRTWTLLFAFTRARTEASAAPAH
ncbi:MAG: TonB family protein [Terriglobales bacterium]